MLMIEWIVNWKGIAPLLLLGVIFLYVFAVTRCRKCGY
jgi:hypothetical protein